MKYLSGKGFHIQKSLKSTGLTHISSWKIIVFCYESLYNQCRHCRKLIWKETCGCVGTLLMLCFASCHSWCKRKSQKFTITSFKNRSVREVERYLVLVPAVHYCMFFLVSELNVLITFSTYLISAIWIGFVRTVLYLFQVCSRFPTVHSVNCTRKFQNTKLRACCSSFKEHFP